MQRVFLLFSLCLVTVFGCDNRNGALGENVLEDYQNTAAAKRYADILKISDLIEAYAVKTKSIPQLEVGGETDAPSATLYQVAVLGQKKAVDQVFSQGTPFNFSLTKYRPEVLQRVLSAGLGKRIKLPIDPQRVGVKFAPVYFVFFRQALEKTPAHYIVMGTFADPVPKSTQVADGVHIVAISNVDVPFVVPVTLRGSFSSKFVEKTMAEGLDADARFERYLPIALE
ncbi:MAG: hypothetical protein AAF337_12415 [Pseudomonadota bacterium]